MGKPVSCFAERLDILMREKKLNQKELAKILDTSTSNISRYLKGIYEPKQDTLLKIQNYFGVSLDWLMGFDVPMYQLINEYLTNDEADIINRYRDFSEDQKDLIKTVIEKLSRFSK